MSRRYVRALDGAVVSERVALDAHGCLRDGFTMSGMLKDGEHVSLSMMFMDATPAGSGPSGEWGPEAYRAAGLRLKDEHTAIADARTTFTDEWPETVFRAAGMTGHGARTPVADASDEWAAALAANARLTR